MGGKEEDQRTEGMKGEKKDVMEALQFSSFLKKKINVWPISILIFMVISIIRTS